jgi:hypothetical protein
MAKLSIGEDDDLEAGAGVVGGVLGAIPGLNIFAPGAAAAMGEAAESNRRRTMAENANSLEVPELDGSAYDEAEYVGDFNPALLGPLSEIEGRTAQIDPRLREAQRRAIEKLAGHAEGAAAANLIADQRAGIADAETMARGLNEGLEQEAAARGMGGGAREMAARTAANTTATNRAARSGLEAARAAAIMRLAGEQAHVGALGGLRGQDQQLEMFNTDVVNDFNARNRDIRNQARMLNWQTQNAAALGNRDARQSNVDRNTGIRNASKDRGNKVKTDTYGMDLEKLAAVNAAIGGQAGQASKVGAKANAAGAQGYDNFKDLMSFMGGGMGG